MQLKVLTLLANTVGPDCVKLNARTPVEAAKRAHLRKVAIMLKNLVEFLSTLVRGQIQMHAAPKATVPESQTRTQSDWLIILNTPSIFSKARVVNKNKPNRRKLYKSSETPK